MTSTVKGLIPIRKIQSRHATIYRQIDVRGNKRDFNGGFSESPSPSAYRS